MTAAFILVLLGLLGSSDAPAADYSCILCCEQRSTRLLLLEENADWSDPRAIRWSWSPNEADDIEPAHRAWFRYLTDGKRVLGGTHVITSASGGGVALVRMKDKRVVFYALADGNTHSVEILPDGNLVSASSTGNYLRVFSTDPAVSRSPTSAKHSDTKLEDAHGVTWDHARERLWAVGGVDLVRYRYNGDRQNPALTEEARFTLPNRGGGHDLFPVPGTRRLFITGGWIWTFDTQTEKFADFPSKLQHGVKSISQREPGGPTLLMVATESWWSDTLRFVNEDRTKRFPQARFYKARWWAPNPFSYGLDTPPSTPSR